MLQRPYDPHDANDLSWAGLLGFVRTSHRISSVQIGFTMLPISRNRRAAGRSPKDAPSRKLLGHP
jgi:hypothetical protein